MTAPAFCTWPYTECCPDDVEVTPDIQDMAGFMLWSATGGQYGPCPVTVRPCDDYRVSCARCGHALGGWGGTCCSCRRLPEIVLPGPVHSILEVTVGGLVVDPDTYRVDDYHWLVNLDGEWPRCPDMLDSGFVVSYQIGLEPPPGAGIAAGELACELAKAFCNDSTCRLPRNVQTMTRQGITVNFTDVIGFIPVVQGWVDSVNNRNRPARVWSPDMPVHRQTTWVNPDSSP